MSYEARKGAFHIVTPPNENLRRDIKARIARQAGIPTRAVDDREIEVLRQMFNSGIVSDPFSAYVQSKYISGRPGESIQQISQSLEVVFQENPESASYGLYMPTYLSGLRGQKDRIGDHPHAALLIGAFSTDTIREYVATVKDVYTNSYCEVIDVDGGRTSEISSDLARFRKGNGLQLPFGNGTLNSVHTNYLLDMLKDETGKDAFEKRIGIFQEAARVLRPEGVLLMIEAGNIPEMLLREELLGAGYSHVDIRRSIDYFKDRSQMELFLRSTASDPLQGTTKKGYGSYFIVARK